MKGKLLALKSVIEQTEHKVGLGIVNELITDVDNGANKKSKVINISIQYLAQNFIVVGDEWTSQQKDHIEKEINVLLDRAVEAVRY